MTDIVFLVKELNEAEL